MQSPFQADQNETLDSSYLYERNVSMNENISQIISFIDSPSQNINLFMPHVLNGVIAYVEVRTGSDNRSKAISKELQQMGATVVSKFSTEVTHVIFKDGKKSTCDKAKKNNVHLVSVLWVDSCKRSRERVSEELFSAGLSEQKGTPIMVARLKKAKSMQPKDFDEEVANSAEKNLKNRKRMITIAKNARLKLLDSGDGDTPKNRQMFRVEDTCSRRLQENFVPIGCKGKTISIPDTPPSMRRKLNDIRAHKSQDKDIDFIPDTDSESESGIADIKEIDKDKKERVQETDDSDNDSPFVNATDGMPLQRRLFEKGTSLMDSADSTLSESSHFQQTSTSSANDNYMNETAVSPYVNKLLQQIEENSQVSTSGITKPKNEKKFKKKLMSTYSEPSSNLITPKNKCKKGISEPETNSEVKMINNNDVKKNVKKHTKKVNLLKEADDVPLKILSTSASRKSSDIIKPLQGNEKRRRKTLLEKEIQSSCGKTSVLNIRMLGDSSRENPSSAISSATTKLTPSYPQTQHVSILKKNEVSDRRRSLRLNPNGVHLKHNPNDSTTIASSTSEKKSIHSNEVQHLKKKNPKNSLEFLAQRRSSRLSMLSSRNDSSQYNTTCNTTALINATSLDSITDVSALSSQNYSFSPSYRTKHIQSEAASSTALLPPSTTSAPATLHQSLSRLSSRKSIDEFLPIDKALRKNISNGKVHNKKFNSSSGAVNQTKNKFKWKKVHIEPNIEVGVTNYIVTTSLHFDEQDIVDSVVKKLGKYSLEENVSSLSTHVVSGGDRRTLNVLYAIARGLWLLSLKWVFESLEAGKWMNESDYELTEYFPACKKSRLAKMKSKEKYCCNIFGSEGMIYVCDNTSPPAKHLKQLIALCAGKITLKVREANICIGKSPKSLLSVSEQWVLDCITQLKNLPKTCYKLNSTLIAEREPSPEF